VTRPGRNDTQIVPASLRLHQELQAHATYQRVLNLDTVNTPTEGTSIMRKTVQALLLASCFLMSFSTSAAFAKDKGKNNGVNVDASVSLGSKKVLDVDADASIGGRKGINANVNANLGSRKGLKANVDARVGSRKNIKADVDVSLGGDQGLNADVDGSIGGKKGVNAGVNVGLGVDDGTPITRPDVTDNNPKTNPGSLSSAQRQAFNAMSPSERNALIKRCNSVGSGGYDPALVNLCKLLRMSASR
jgi:hypothetical protein